MPPRPMDAAKLWAKENLENVEAAKLWKHEMCGWNNKGRANLKLKAEYGGIEWRTLSIAVRQLWPSVEKIPGSNRKTDYLKDVRLKAGRYRYPFVFFSFFL